MSTSSAGTGSTAEPTAVIADVNKEISSVLRRRRKRRLEARRSVEQQRMLPILGRCSLENSERHGEMGQAAREAIGARGAARPRRQRTSSRRQIFPADKAFWKPQEFG